MQYIMARKLKLSMAITQTPYILTLVLTITQHLNTMLFDSPEIRKLIEHDNQFLANGKINWESKLLYTTIQLMNCYKKFSKYEDFSDSFNSENYESFYQNKTDSQITDELERLEHSLNETIQEDKRQEIMIKIWNLRELMNARSNLSELLNHIANAEHNHAVENLANEIKNWESREFTQEGQPLPYQYSWKDVALSMLRIPDKVIFDYDYCPDCGHSRISLFFSSPEWTWSMMCGVGGNMVICPECKVQSEFNYTIRN